MNVFDAHLHIIDPRFPLVPNQGYTPPAFDVETYRRRVAALLTDHRPIGGAVVSGSFQAFDQSYLVTALERLGPRYVGVTQLPPEVTDAEILRLDAVGVRALRFNLRRGGSATVRDLRRFAARIDELAGWHVELYVTGDDLEALEPTLKTLPRVVVDHLGLRRAGLAALQRLVDHGIQVKATGFGRLDFDPRPVLRSLADAAPQALLFGTDLPSTRAPRPFEGGDLELLVEALTPEQAELALWRNAVTLYRPAERAETSTTQSA
ncbi:MAG: amidohydrolase family protein [Acidobacteriota bacterium]